MAGLQTSTRFTLHMNHDYDPADDLPFYTEEELEELAIEQEQLDWERSIPTPADRNPRLK